MNNQEIVTRLPLGIRIKAEELMASNSPVRGEKWWLNGNKKVFDYAVCLIFAPGLLAAAAGAVWVWSRDRKNPILKLKRWHPNGIIEQYKLRTMVPGAELLDDGVFGGRPMQEVKNRGEDPRIIEGTQWLRKLSIDELLQLLNVMKDRNMALVGPRPISGYQKKQEYDPNSIDPVLVEWTRNLEKGLRYGITGLGQVLYRDQSEADLTRYLIDVFYARNVTMRGDWRLVLATLNPKVWATGK